MQLRYDLDTVLHMIPLKMVIVGVRWQLAVIVFIMTVLVWLAWRYLRRLRLPVSWPWVMCYAAAIALASEAIYRASKLLDDVVGIHIEVLLPAFVLGCMLARPVGHDPHADDAREGHQEGPEDSSEQRVSTRVSAVFMVLVGMSMPAVSVGGPGGLPWWALLGHVVAITLLANLGKMFALFCYRREVSWRERLAVSIAMSGKVLAQVENVNAGLGFSDALRLELLDGVYGRRGMRLQNGL